MESKSYVVALSIAGSDSGGGAGIQADIKTMSALGVFATTAITAVTAQNTRGVRMVQAMPPEVVHAQIEAVMEDMPVRSIKIGMLFSVPIIEAVADALKSYAAEVPIVLDPVMIAQSGDPLIRKGAIEAMKRQLFPLATLITPNLPEAAALLGTAFDEEHPAQSMEAWEELQVRAVLIKGGHNQASSQIIDYLLVPDKHLVHRFEHTRISTNNTHGTGCTLSSAIAAYLAQGYELMEAVERAEDYLVQALEKGAGWHLGKGAGPVHHFHAFWQTLPGTENN